MSSGYDTAQVCLNGHMITDAIHEFPHYVKKFCPDCGASTITKCPSCDHDLEGHQINGSYRGKEKVDAFCHSCGNPFPWTKAQLKAAADIAEEDENITPEDKQILQESIPQIVLDTPSTGVAATRIKRIFNKLGKDVPPALWKITLDVATEAAKKIILPT